MIIYTDIANAKSIYQKKVNFKIFISFNIWTNIMNIIWTQKVNHLILSSMRKKLYKILASKMCLWSTERDILSYHLVGKIKGFTVARYCKNSSNHLTKTDVVLLYSPYSPILFTTDDFFFWVLDTYTHQQLCIIADQLKKAFQQFINSHFPIFYHERIIALPDCNYINSIYFDN